MRACWRRPGKGGRREDTQPLCRRRCVSASLNPPTHVTHPHTNSSSGGAPALLPTRAQAELDDGDDDEGGSSSNGRVRGEPRSVEEAGPLRVLYEGHDLLIVDKVGWGLGLGLGLGMYCGAKCGGAECGQDWDWVNRLSRGEF